MAIDKLVVLLNLLSPFDLHVGILFFFFFCVQEI